MLRAVAAKQPSAHAPQTYWRGMKDLGLTMEFLKNGGTEFACLSTSASKDIAFNFAKSALPLVFKFETKDFASRGANISFPELLSYEPIADPSAVITAGQFRATVLTDKLVRFEWSGGEGRADSDSGPTFEDRPTTAQISRLVHL